MAKSIKLTDNNYIDASGVYDNTKQLTQNQFNDTVVRYSHFEQNFEHNITGQVVNVPLPSFEHWCRICIMFSHVQDLYGKISIVEIRKIYPYITEAEIFTQSHLEDKNNFTYDVVSKNPTNISLTITTGSTLTHDLTVDFEYY